MALYQSYLFKELPHNTTRAHVNDCMCFVLVENVKTLRIKILCKYFFYKYLYIIV